MLRVGGVTAMTILTLHVYWPPNVQETITTMWRYYEFGRCLLHL